MRLALQRIEIIERYLSGEMDAAEKDNFEKRLKDNPKLQEDLALQTELQAGIQRYALKKRIQKASSRYQLHKKLWQWGGGILIFMVAATTYWQLQPRENATPLEKLWQIFQTEEKVQSDADLYLEPQYFDIALEADTVLESKSGIVVAIPEDAFVDNLGNPVKGNIRVELKEAIEPADIIKAGLTTESDGKLLESGGMYYFNASQNGKKLQIADGKSIYIELPTQEVKEDMQLFTGALTPEGKINWVDPQPLANYLKPVDINKLNFYPPNYFKALGKLDYNIEDKTLTDSIFYSFSCFRADFEKWYRKPLKVDHFVADNKPSISPPIIKQVGYVPPREDSATASVVLEETSIEDLLEDDGSCNRHLNPSDIRAIWNDEFQNTNLATKEFEERLPYIYWACTKEVFDLYVQHLDWPLYRVDSMVSTLNVEIDPFYTEHATSTFKKFYERRDGKVDIKDGLAKKLGDYYLQKSKAYADALKKTRAKMKAEARQFAKQADAKRNEQTSANIKRRQQNFQQELQSNLEDAYKQLGYNPRAAIRNLNRPVVRQRYRTSIQQTGWYNVDKYVTDATISRESMEFTDASTGKKAVIRYDSLRLKVREQENYDRCYSYLISKQQYSFRRLKESQGYFHEKLNKRYAYEVLVVAYKDDQAYFNRMGALKAGDTAISLAITSEDEINAIVNRISHRQTARDMLKDLAYFAFERAYSKRKAKARSIQKIHDRLYPIIFPCGERRYPLHAAKLVGFNPPYVIEADLNDAIKEIEQGGWKVGKINYLPSEYFKAGTVVGQDPLPRIGRVFKKPGTIDLEVIRNQEDSIFESNPS